MEKQRASSEYYVIVSMRVCIYFMTALIHTGLILCWSLVFKGKELETTIPFVVKKETTSYPLQWRRGSGSSTFLKYGSRD